MTALILILLASVGATQIITHGKIFTGPRTWLQAHAPAIPITCNQCVGVWCGIACALLHHIQADWLLYGFAASLCAVTMGKFHDWLEANSVVVVNQ